MLLHCCVSVTLLASTTLSVVNFRFSTVAVMRDFRWKVYFGLVRPEPVSFTYYDGYLISAVSIFSVLLL